jgi:isoleucyl-tRNA synthetase
MRDTLFLPETSFNLRAGLAKKEPHIQQWWARKSLENLQSSLRVKEKSFILHDGPPYANGAIHMGHAMNKILKDFVNRSAFMMGYRIAFVPGWDCHGLPIEAKIEEHYREEKIDKTTVHPKAFRQRCRDFAQKWVHHQKTEMRRLGGVGFWDQAYETMDPVFEVAIVRQIFRLLRSGYIYRGTKPVMWSPVEETALAEAEVEYKEVVSRALHVGFPIIGWDKSLKTGLSQGDIELKNRLLGSKIVIWTTTAWTLPANRALCYGSDFTYILLRLRKEFCGSDGIGMPEGTGLVLAQDRLQSFLEALGLQDGQWVVEERFSGNVLEGVECAHPLADKGYDNKVPLLPGDHVTLDVGTGLVHTAPNHGLEDFYVVHALPKEKALDTRDVLDGKGFYLKDVPLFAGNHIWKVYPKMRQALLESGSLLQDLPYHHSYPHSWRSKTPLIYRATPQWFIAMDGDGQLRQKALEAIEKVEWHPSSSKNRITAMVTQRPDWCISRQRLWGIPIAFFVHKQTGQPLMDEAIHDRILNYFVQNGLDSWFDKEVFQILSPEYDPQDFQRIQDIVDVWFESGVTHAIVLRGPYGSHIQEDGQTLGLSWPAAMYFEGSDQHRGWFQSSLLTSCALEACEGRSSQGPFERVLTHGFLLNESSEKMSKSSGKALSPQGIIESNGADLLRMWVANAYYPEDVRIGPGILEQAKELYGRFRNTLRYLLGNLKDFHPEEWISFEEMPPLERWVLARLYDLGQQLDQKIKEFRYQDAIQLIHHFCSSDLSSFYFDVRKDILYCGDKKSHVRRSCRTVLALLFSHLSRWLAPFLCFTMEEAWSVFGQEVLGLVDGVALSDCVEEGASGGWVEPVAKVFEKESNPSGVQRCHESLKKLLLDLDIDYCMASSCRHHGASSSDGLQDLACHVWSIHLQRFPKAQEGWKDHLLLDYMIQIRKIRSVVTGAIEKARQQKVLGSSLQGRVCLYLGELYQDLWQYKGWVQGSVENAVALQGLGPLEDLGKAKGDCPKEKEAFEDALETLLKELSIVSAIKIYKNSWHGEEKNLGQKEYFSLDSVPEVAVLVAVASGEKCQRCWHVLEEVQLCKDSLCRRCQAVVEKNRGGQD